MIKYWKVKALENHLKILQDEKDKGTVTRPEIMDIKIKLRLMKASWESGYAEGFNDGFDKKDKS